MIHKIKNFLIGGELFEPQIKERNIFKKGN
jgi:hypothetical protein